MRATRSRFAAAPCPTSPGTRPAPSGASPPPRTPLRPTDHGATTGSSTGSARRGPASVPADASAPSTNAKALDRPAPPAQPEPIPTPTARGPPPGSDAARSTRPPAPAWAQAAPADPAPPQGGEPPCGPAPGEAPLPIAPVLPPARVPRKRTRRATGRADRTLPPASPVRAEATEPRVRAPSPGSTTASSTASPRRAVDGFGHARSESRFRETRYPVAYRKEITTSEDGGKLLT